MEHDSPLKTWVRRHSPMRNKPLPVAPNCPASSNTNKSPLRAVSGNTSPSKQQTTKSKLRSFLRARPQEPSPPGSPTSSYRPKSKEEGRKRPHAFPTDGGEHRSSIRKSLRPRQRSSDLRGLSLRISSLESQLQEAKLQLRNVSEQASTTIYDAEELELAQKKPKRGRLQTYAKDSKLGRLAENWRDQHKQIDDPSGLMCRSANDLLTNYDDGRSFDDVVDRDSAYDLQDEVQQHKRRRSEVRQASWETVQSHLQRQQLLQQQAYELREVRPSSSMSLGVPRRSKDLPELPRFVPPERSGSAEHVIEDSGEDMDCDDCPPLDRQQISFPQAAQAPSDEAPKVKRHQRRRSQIIATEQLQEAFGQDGPAGPDSRPRNESPTRRKLSSPSRLDKVEEEFEWDEDVF